jgi:hypothetical protein
MMRMLKASYPLKVLLGFIGAASCPFDPVIGITSIYAIKISVFNRSILGPSGTVIV